MALNSPPSLFYLAALKEGWLPIYLPWKVTCLVGRLMPRIRFKPLVSGSSLMREDRVLNVFDHEAQAQIMEVYYNIQYVIRKCNQIHCPVSPKVQSMVLVLYNILIKCTCATERPRRRQCDQKMLLESRFLLC